MTTFQYQNQLEKLPIPPLQDTLQRYLKVIKPLESEEEYQETVKSCNSFAKSIGPKLQNLLIEYSKTKDSYIEQFWFDSYLNYDSPVVLNLNPFIMIEDDPIPGECNWINRGCQLTNSTLRFIKALRNKTLPVDKIKGDKPLDMDQYLKLFGSCRIPTNNGCVLKTYENSKHIVVVVNSQFYWFNVLDDDNNLLLTEDEIKTNLKSIINDSTEFYNKDNDDDNSNDSSSINIAKSSFGVLTTENRKVWSNLRNILNSDSINKEILKIIDSSLFCLVLDNLEVGQDANKISQNFLCGKSIIKNGVQIGTCTNRWYDKLQLIVTKDGKSGINFEHTGIDGHTVLRFASDIYTDSILRFAKTINKDSPSLFEDELPKESRRSNSNSDNLTNSPPRKLEWNLTNELSLSLRFAETRLSDLISQNEFSTLMFNKYGMERIKKMGMSPDAFIQMSFQLTYYKLYGKIECTYEPAMTKKFLHGRTEAIRSVSDESCLLVKNFFNDDISNEEKIKLLKNACKEHSRRTAECSNGLGQDRHLYALYCIWEKYFCQNNNSESDYSSEEEDLIVNKQSDANDEEIPLIFKDEGWKKLNTTIISTSNCGNPSLKIFGFGPVSENGFGIGYIIKDNRISFCVSSKHRQTSRFTDTLGSVLTLMEQVNSIN